MTVSSVLPGKMESLYLKARDLVKEALELQENIDLSNFAEKREDLFVKQKP